MNYKTLTYVLLLFLGSVLIVFPQDHQLKRLREGEDIEEDAKELKYFKSSENPTSVFFSQNEAISPHSPIQEVSIKQMFKQEQLRSNFAQDCKSELESWQTLERGTTYVDRWNENDIKRITYLIQGNQKEYHDSLAKPTGNADHRKREYCKAVVKDLKALTAWVAMHKEKSIFSEWLFDWKAQSLEEKGYYPTFPRLVRDSEEFEQLLEVVNQKYIHTDDVRRWRINKLSADENIKKLYEIAQKIQQIRYLDLFKVHKNFDFPMDAHERELFPYAVHDPFVLHRVRSVLGRAYGTTELNIDSFGPYLNSLSSILKNAHAFIAARVENDLVLFPERYLLSVDKSVFRPSIIAGSAWLKELYMRGKEVGMAILLALPHLKPREGVQIRLHSAQQKAFYSDISLISSQSLSVTPFPI